MRITPRRTSGIPPKPPGAEDDGDVRLFRAWSASRQALGALIAVGVLIAFVSGAVGAAVVVAALGALVVTQVAISLVHYRRTMRRPWPDVAPLTDDDDD